MTLLFDLADLKSQNKPIQIICFCCYNFPYILRVTTFIIRNNKEEYQRANTILESVIAKTILESAVARTIYRDNDYKWYSSIIYLYQTKSNFWTKLNHNIIICFFHSLGYTNLLYISGYHILHIICHVLKITWPSIKKIKISLQLSRTSIKSRGRNQQKIYPNNDWLQSLLYFSIIILAIDEHFSHVLR